MHLLYNWDIGWCCCHLLLLNHHANFDSCGCAIGRSGDHLVYRLLNGLRDVPHHVEALEDACGPHVLLTPSLLVFVSFFSLSISVTSSLLSYCMTNLPTSRVCDD